MATKVKKDIWFHYLLTEIQLYTFILLELNIFLKKYKAKSKINQLLTIYLEYKMMNLLCLEFIVLLSYNICWKKNLCYIILILFSSNDYNKNVKIIYKCFNNEYVKSRA